MTTGKTIKQRFMAIIFSLVLTIAGAGLAVQTAQPVSVEAATTVRLNQTKATRIKGQSLQLKIVGTSSKVQWSTSNNKVATVNSAGRVIAVNKGTATITAKVGSKPYTCRLTVETPKLSKTAISLNEKKTYTLKISGTTQKITWKSSNTSIATVSSAGKVTAKKAGTATITATILNKKYNCKVTVKKVPVASNVPTCVASQTMYAMGNFGGPEIDEFLGMKRIMQSPENFIFIKNLASNAQITSISSSNKKLEAYKRDGMDAIVVGAKMSATSEPSELVGETSTISFKVIQNGKTYSLSCKISIKQSTSPFASVKLGSKEVGKYFDGYWNIKGLNIKGKQKITVKMASGYVFDSIEVATKDGKLLTGLKNGVTVDISKANSVSICYHTTKKPANYKAPTKWNAMVPSPLHAYGEINFFL